MFKGNDEDRVLPWYGKANRGRCEPDVYGKTQITSEPQGKPTGLAYAGAAPLQAEHITRMQVV